jgi:M6 family metalloprotease-like protein
LTAGCLAAGAIAAGASNPVPTAWFPDPRRGVEPSYFRLDPAGADTVFRLLVIPVRFPEDASPLSREALTARLGAGDPGSLAAYWDAATGGRLDLAVTLAPNVTATHSRRYYTVEGTGNSGYGTDPDAYPHNAQRLVEEAVAAVSDAVDLRRFDNTGDGIVDGLLILHTGPRSAEASETVLPPDVLVAHAFTLPSPETIGGALVFPYAVAGMRDGVGVWAHEMGHLLGFPDLYAGNPFCPGPGVGEWSLMATGANRDQGDDPSGLDPYTRQLLGERAIVPGLDPVDLTDGAFVRVYRPGEASGPRYFLIEARTGDDGLGLESPSYVVYFVDETEVDNRTCTSPPDLPRGLVTVRAAVPLGGAEPVVLDDTTNPPLTDPDGTPTGLEFTFQSGTARVRWNGPVAVRVERARLGTVRASLDTGAEEQCLRFTVRNLDPAIAHEVNLSVSPGWTGPADLCLVDRAALPLVLAPGEARDDSALAFSPCVPGALPAGEARLEVRAVVDGIAVAPPETLVFVVNRWGLDPAAVDRFTTRNRNPSRRSPWAPLPGTPADTVGWVAEDLDRFADGELRSPWFAVPENGRLIIDHAWDLEALVPDVALDGGQVRLFRQLAPEAILGPPGGWGFTAERGTGNALGGLEVLSGNGSRRHVLALDDYAGETVRLVLRAAGDVDLQDGSWRVDRTAVTGPPAIAYVLTSGPEGLRAHPLGVFEPDVQLVLYGGLLATTPVTVLATARPGPSVVELDGGMAPRLELVWEDASGRWGATMLTREPPVTAAPVVLAVPAPNPLHRGTAQTWTLRLNAGDPGGSYHLALVAPDGRRLLDRRLRIDVPGTRLVTWDGRDDAGRTVPAGVYVLTLRRPDGKREGRRIVVLP